MESKVMLAVPTMEMGKHTAFWDYFNLLDKPEGTVCTMVHGQSPATGRNKMIEAALEHDCTHILFIDDDVCVPPDTIKRLLAHDVDIVSGYYVMRQFPHQGLIFDKAFPDGQCRWYEVEDDEIGLREVVAAGLGCCMFKTHVFEALEKPWVRLGELEACKDGWCDDIGLFMRVREAGFKIHMDLDLQCAHIGSATFKPIRKDGKWMVEIGTFSSDTVAFPMVRKPKDAPKPVSPEERVKQIYIRIGEIIRQYEMESNIPLHEPNSKQPHEYWLLKKELNGIFSPA